LEQKWKSVIMSSIFVADCKEYKPKIAKKPPRSHSPTGKAVGRPPSVKTCLQQIQADVDDYRQELLAGYSEEVQKYAPCYFIFRSLISAYLEQQQSTLMTRDTYEAVK
jgi:hypothetical protein